MAEPCGSVCLVGAGPSDAGLMTLRGYAALRRADTVVYDHLLGCGVLAMIPPSSEKIYVGKVAGHHAVPQEEINRILIREAKKGRRVVRLKGGDPFLFGRGGEELEALRGEGIPCAVVPGVTSAIAAPAYAGIPVTHREHGSSLHIFTGHPSAHGSGLPEFSVLARLGGTLVFLMGVSAAGRICEGLVSAGMPAETPAAAVENGTTARQRTVCATLATLAAEMKAAGVRPPAVLVVGETAALAGRLDWAASLPLHGRRIVVTRPAGSCESFCRRIEALGGEAVAFPCLETVSAAGDSLARAVTCLSEFTWLTFSSRTGVDAFFDALFRAGKDARALAGRKIAAVGPSTARQLRQHGVSADLVPRTFSSRSLGEALACRAGGHDRVLVVRAEDGSPDLEKALAASGIPAEAAAAYETRPAERHEAPELLRLVETGDFDCAAFFSASAVRGFAAAVPEAVLAGGTAVCIGEPTAAEAEKHGMRTVMPRAATADGMLEALAEHH